MNEKTIRLEISNLDRISGEWVYSDLSLPAEEHEIKDAFQRARLTSAYESPLNAAVYNSSVFPPLTNMRLDSPSVLELNFLAQRYSELDEDEIAVLNSVWRKYITEDDDPVSMKTLINLTYGLDEVSVISGVTNLKMLGEFVIENDMHPDISAIPKESLYLLDRMTVGELQRKEDGGIFNRGKYIVTNDYELKKVYNGKLPQSEPSNTFAFKLELTKLPVDEDGNLTSPQAWIKLPASKEDIRIVETKLGLDDIREALYVDFVSIIPQIESSMFPDMHDFNKLNELSSFIVGSAAFSQAKYKAILEAEKPQSLDELFDIAENFDRYEFNPTMSTPETYFRTYLSLHLPTDFDLSWLDSIATNREGEKLSSRMECKFTNYGLISSRDGSLFDLIIREPEEDEEYDMDEEDSDIGMGGM